MQPTAPTRPRAPRLMRDRWADEELPCDARKPIAGFTAVVRKRQQANHAFPIQGRRRDKGSDRRGTCGPAHRSARLGYVGQFVATGQCAPAWHRRLERIPSPSRVVGCRTRQRRLRVQRRLQVLGGTLASSLGQPLDNARAHVLPGFTGRFTAHHTARSSFDLSGPGGFDLGGILRRGFIETGE